MKTPILYLLALLCTLSLGASDLAFAENLRTVPMKRGSKKELSQIMAFISSVSNIEYQTLDNDKERREHYSVFRFDQCLIKISDETSVVEIKSQKPLGTLYDEITVNLADIDAASIAGAEQKVLDHEEYLRVTASCRGAKKCVNEVNSAGNATPASRMLDRFSFIARKSTGKAELETAFSKAIRSCSPE